MSRPVRLLAMYPQLLNLNGDLGNIEVLAKRLEWRGESVEILKHNPNEVLGVHDPDFLLIGHGQLAAWRVIGEDLRLNQEPLIRLITSGIPALAVGSGYECLHSEMDYGLGHEVRPEHIDEASFNDDARVLSDAAVFARTSEVRVGVYPEVLGRQARRSQFASAQLLGKDVVGYLNSDSDAALIRKDFATVGTLLHGPVLAKNPWLADWFCDQILSRVARTSKGHSVKLDFVDEMARLARATALEQVPKKP